VFGLPGGTLTAGAHGDITLIDLGARYEVTKEFASKAANSPFIGQAFEGRPVTTIVGGVVKHDIRVAGNVRVPSDAKKRKRK
jgi:dihydroorotase